MTSFTDRLRDLGIELPMPMAPIANYVPFVRSGDLIVISGQIPARDGKVAFTGKLGGGVSLETGTEAAALCFINLLAQLQAAIGDLGKLKKELEKDEPNGDAITKLIGKLGASTTKSAAKIEDEKVAEKVRHLGEALTNSGTHDGSDDEDEG